MENENVEEMSMKDMLDALGKGVMKIKSGDILPGKVISVTKDEVFVNIGYMTDGIISKEELSDEEGVDPRDIVKPGDEMQVCVLEVNDGEGSVALSRRKALKADLWTNIKKGEKRKGKVSRLAPFGAFVDLGGADGLIHISQLSWKNVKDPSEVLSVGDIVEAIVLDFDKESGKISLSLKDESVNPWNNVLVNYKVGDVVEGTVVRVVDFGAFVEIEPGIDGLVHISQISEERVLKVSNVLKPGDKVKVKILEINEKDRRMSLSIKEAAEKEEGDSTEYRDELNDQNTTLGELFKDKFKDLKF